MKLFEEVFREAFGVNADKHIIPYIIFFKLTMSISLNLVSLLNVIFFLTLAWMSLLLSIKLLADSYE